MKAFRELLDNYRVFSTPWDLNGDKYTLGNKLAQFAYEIFFDSETQHVATMLFSLEWNFTFTTLPFRAGIVHAPSGT